MIRALIGWGIFAIALLQEGPTGNDALVFGVLWGPYGRAARALPAFPEFAR